MGHPRDTGLYTRSQMGLDQMTRAERAAERAEIASMLPAYNVAKVIGAVFTIIGFGVFFFSSASSLNASSFWARTS